jgi:outer membrane protein OmpA-like peptidoglycan-associated protein
MRRPTIARNAAALAVAAILAACASTPETLQQVESARTAVSAARADAEVTRYAPQELERATQLLSSAEAAQEKRDREVAAHFGYLAEQTARLATQRSRAAVAEQRVAGAQSERDRVLLQAREAEAERARAAATAAKAENDRLVRELAELQARPTERGTVLTLAGDVLFATGRAELKGGAERMLTQVEQFLEQNPERRARIEGFTDSTGSDEYNLELSRRRAEAVREALVRRGIDGSRIETAGLGEAYPVADNTSPGGRQLNRRVEIIIGNDAAEVAGR